MRDVIAIIKKEMYRFFTDKRMVISSIILPGVLIYIAYSVMGGAMMKSGTVDEDYVPTVYTENMPDEMSVLFEALECNIKPVDESGVDAAKADIVNQKADCLVCFPDEFSINLTAPQAEFPNVEVYFISTSPSSLSTYTVITNALNAYESSFVNLFDVNGIKDGEINYDLTTKEDTNSKLWSSFLPMVLIMLIFSGCISFAPDSFAGEKDRGTIATLLVTPLSRKSLAVGKVVSLSVFALLNGLSSFIGTVLAIPKMVGDTMDISASVYGIKEYACLLLVIFSSVIFIISILSIISAISKTAKEAASMCSPLMIGATLLGTITNMQYDMSAPSWRLIPVLNSILCINDILEFNISTMNIVITCISNILFAVIFVCILTKLLNSEKIVFTK